LVGGPFVIPLKGILAKKKPVPHLFPDNWGLSKKRGPKKEFGFFSGAH